MNDLRVDLFLPASGGTEALLAEEVQRITGQAAEHARGGVWVRGGFETAMQLNLESRLAQRVLWPLADGPYRDEHDLYADRKSTRLNSSHVSESRMPSSA